MKTNVFKRVFIATVAICTGLFFASCENKGNAEHKKQPTITQGVYGYTVKGKSPALIEVYVYEYTKVSDFEEKYQSLNDFPLNHMPTTFIVKTISDKDGFYEISLQPGKYSLFLLNNGMLYANEFDMEGGICPIEIETENIIKKDIIFSE